MKRLQTMSLLAGVLGVAPAWALPPTPQQDEARIEEIMLAEAVAARDAQADTAAAAADVPVIAAAAPAAAGSEAGWLAASHADTADTLGFDDLKARIGKRVTIITINERQHRGTVVAVDAREVQLSVRRAGGVATYALPRDQIQRIESQ